MEKAVLLRSLSSTSTLAFSRIFSRSSHKFASYTAKRHRLLQNLHRRRSLLRSNIRGISHSVQLKRQFYPLSVRAIATSAPQSSQDFVGADDEVAEKFGFEKLSEQFIDECKSKAVLYKHKKTGAEVMSVANDDENKVFGVVFRTPPKDSTGIPHILEHSVLCGSRKYPLKEPFVELLKGSLNTFLNAFTYPDRTCYPVASTNTKDFYNLVDVYLDAVFFPKCVEDFQTFQQEGWHYELNDPSEDITFKGVVFNEMKGVYSQPDNLLGRTSQQVGNGPEPVTPDRFNWIRNWYRNFHTVFAAGTGVPGTGMPEFSPCSHRSACYRFGPERHRCDTGRDDTILALFPDNTYGVDSGGDPRVIPSLSFEEFKEFHRKFYHPSNARIWFYGDDDPNERLRILSGTYSFTSYNFKCT
ncbi:Presequence protease 2, chloroplastic/mitochondrial [Capsicum annuum]|uniref:Presequence protease 2, chloroplastic/mitochondrial n=1 Tax=Capsicum annuum TaxID=4072 RepID=A0A2G2Y058_CAPAN|nr:Presequence protease 2, chloroplastic/mitochondrial [Capsicum annuum]